LLKHLNDNNILSKHQFGLKQKQGTENANFGLISGIPDPLNKKIQVCGLCCDLYKSYLLNRQQRTAILNGTVAK
jgi:hypothetical protein